MHGTAVTATLDFDQEGGVVVVDWSCGEIEQGRNRDRCEASKRVTL